MKRTILPLLLICCLATKAQSIDFGTQYQLSTHFKTWKGGELALAEELRIVDNSRRFAKSETSIELQHSLLRKQFKPYGLKWRIGGGYSFIIRQNNQFLTYPQHRFMVQTAASKQLGTWRLGARIRLQTTYRNPATGDYRFNPQSKLRTRLSAQYQPHGSMWQYALSEEYFIRIADPRGALLDEFRTQLSATRQLNKTQSFTLFAKLSNEVQVKAPEHLLALGIELEL
ncbi:MAG: DUF2490 domain-containing protein [Bacteroidales bacterium]|nr:DUF2490 domain-containing protein [Bacteroidales bacterium]